MGGCLASSFSDLFNNLQPVYTTSKNDIVSEFYVPVLERAVSYDRVTGFFSSTSLSVAARGLSKFLLNPNSKMRMIVSISGFEERDDINNIYNVDDIVTSQFNNILKEDIALLEDMIIKRRIEALGWLLKSGRLEIKVAIMSRLKFDQGMLHSKFGILSDVQNNIICFSGSINESRNGWKINGEAISVYNNNIEGHVPFIKTYVSEFNAYWENKVDGVRVIDLPSAIKNKLIDYAREDITTISNSIDPEVNPYIKNEKSIRQLFYYQEEAIQEWFKNNKVGFLEMATGTGKTLTAINSVKILLKTNTNLCTIIAVPTDPLVSQWKKELEEEGIGPEIITLCSSKYPDWRKTFRRSLLLNKNQADIFVFTYQSLCSDEVQDFLNNSKREILIICDEMHHAGSTEFSKVLNKNIKWRLGLSATPIRERDMDGTKLLLDYFGEKPLIIFNIMRALTEINPRTGKTYLCPYNYYFNTVEFSIREHKEFKRLSKLIAIQKGKNKIDDEDSNQPDKQRALLISCAAGKLEIFDNLIKDIKKLNKHKRMLVYTQSFISKDIGERQIDSVRKILYNNNLNSLDFTSKFDDPIEREHILSNLRNDNVDAVIAIRCLDEGIDLPDIRTAIILSSSSNSAQFIQRRGRILRNSTGKDHADIYDFLVGPPNLQEISESDITLIKREYARATEYAKYALNSVEALSNIYKWIATYNLSEVDMGGGVY